MCHGRSLQSRSIPSGFLAAKGCRIFPLFISPNWNGGCDAISCLDGTSYTWKWSPCTNSKWRRSRPSNFADIQQPNLSKPWPKSYKSISNLIIISIFSTWMASLKLVEPVEMSSGAIPFLDQGQARYRTFYSRRSVGRCMAKNWVALKKIETQPCNCSPLVAKNWAEPIPMGYLQRMNYKDMRQILYSIVLLCSA